MPIPEMIGSLTLLINKMTDEKSKKELERIAKGLFFLHDLHEELMDNNNQHTCYDGTVRGYCTLVCSHCGPHVHYRNFQKYKDLIHASFKEGARCIQNIRDGEVLEKMWNLSKAKEEHDKLSLAMSKIEVNQSKLKEAKVEGTVVC